MTRKVVFYSALLILTICASLHELRADPIELGRNAVEVEDSVARIKNTLRSESVDSSNLVLESVRKLRQDNREPSPVSETGIPMMKALGLCIGVFLIGVAVVRRLQGTSYAPRTARLQVVERTALTQKHALVLARLDGQEYLLAVSPDAVVFCPHELQESSACTTDTEHGRTLELAIADNRGS